MTAEHIGFMPDGPEITLEDIQQAQEGWGDAVAKIGKAGKKGGQGKS